MSTEGMVIVESVPPIGGGGDGGVGVPMLAITTAIAPAACAFFTLATKVQSPRSSSTIPDSCELNSLQPFVDPALSTGAVKVPATPVLVSGGPNSASPTRYSRARLGGNVTVRVGVPATKKLGAADRVIMPSQTSCRGRMAHAARS